MKKFLILIFLTTFSFTNIVCANNNIVYVDIDKVLSTSKTGLYILKQLQDLRIKNIKDFEKKAESLKENEKKIIKQKNIISSEDFQLKINELKIEVKKYNTYRDGKIKNFQKLKADSTGKLLELINPILTKYAKDNSIAMVIQKKYIIIGATELDITNTIIKLTNKNIKDFKIK